MFCEKLNDMKGDTFSGITMEQKDKPGFVFSATEKDLIMENIKRILTTRKGERVNEPEFGSDVLAFLFMPQIYVDDLMSLIKFSIEKWEPRVIVNSVTLKTLGQDDTVTIGLNMTIVNPEDKEVIIDEEVTI